MVELNIMESFGIAILLGIIVGLEREFQQQKQRVGDFGGIRTFLLISVLGWLVGFIAKQQNAFTLVIITLLGFILLVIAAYIAVVWKGEKVGATTELSAIILFLLGVLVAFNYILIAATAAILMATILSYKYHLHAFAKKINLDEIHAGLKLAIISAIVLPLLPNKAYSPTDIPVINDIIQLFPSVYDLLSVTQIFNPFKIWLLVVFICAISSVGYLLIKTLGIKGGIGLTGAVGGLVSSTAVTSSLAESSKKGKLVYSFAFGVIIAWTIMFIRVLFVTLVLNKEVFISSLSTIGVMTLASAGCAIHLYFQRTPQGKKAETAVAFESPFALIPALKLGAVFVIILFLTKLLQALLGSPGIYVTSILAGAADVDAVTITLVTLASIGEIHTGVAVAGVVLAVLSNTIIKAAIAYAFGGREFAKNILKYTAVIIAAGILSLLLF